jgi:hypothetical protein
MEYYVVSTESANKGTGTEGTGSNKRGLEREKQD